MAIKHGVHDTDTHYIVDPISRAAKNDGLKKVSIVRDDHHSEVCTFELPRYVEGHDMAKCNRVEVHYINTHSQTKETSTGIYVAADFGICETDPEKVTFSWLISCAATKYPGQLAFALHFACVDPYTDEIQYWWSTALNTSISVLETINNSGTSGGEGGEGSEGGESEEGGENTNLQGKTVTPTKEIQVVRPDGEFSGLSKVIVEPIPDEYVAPSGSLFVDANGDYEIRDYANITVNVPPNLHQKTIKMNGFYTPDAGYDGLSGVLVNIADSPAILQEKTVYPSTSDQSVVPDSDFDGLSKVTVEGMRLQSVTVTKNGEVIPDHGFDGLASVTINVDNKLQDKTEECTENGEYDITADSGYEGLRSVKVKVEVEETGKLQEKVITSNGEYEPDKDYKGFSLVTVKVPQTIYTGVETAGGEYPVYGGVSNPLVVSNYSSVAYAAKEYTSGVLYSGLKLGLVANSATSTVTADREYTVDVKAVTGSSAGKYLVYFYENGTQITNVYVDDVSQIGYKIKWVETFSPGTYEGFPYGGAKCNIQHCYISRSTGEMTGGYTERFVGFKSEAEYKAALNLTVEPQGLVQINEVLIDYDEETEA